MKLLLDTNAYSALRRGNERVADHVREAHELLISSIVAGELLFGFRHGSRQDENVLDFKQFLAEPRVQLVAVTWQTAVHFGEISTMLRRRGRPIPTNDVWIAAHALETGAHLVSADRHFEAIEGLPYLTFEPL